MKKYEESAPFYKSEQLIEILEFLTEGQQSIKSAPSEKTALEILLLKILRTHQQISLNGLVERLILLEKQLSTCEDPTPKPEELPKAKTPVPIPEPKPSG